MDFSKPSSDEPAVEVCYSVGHVKAVVKKNYKEPKGS